MAHKKPGRPTSILDKGFKYHASFDTDVRRTWRRAQREQQQAQKPAPAAIPLRKRSAS